MAVLGNGPSLTRELPGLLERTGDRDFMAVNFFALDERFTLLRPAYYVLSDPMFFRESAFRDRVAGLYRAMNGRVSWPMTLYVQYYNPERFDYRAVLPNPLIRIVPFHTYMYRGFRSVEFWLFRRGLGSANFGTVVQVGEYVALLGTGAWSCTAWTIRCSKGCAWTAGTVFAVPTGTITMRERPRRRSRFSGRFRPYPIRWRRIWPRWPNCSAATRCCATTPPRSGRGS